MLAELRRTEPIVAATFDEADAIMRPLLDGRALSDIIFTGPDGEAEAEAQLMRTEITQPAVLTVDIALTRLLAAYGVEPDFVMGHSLGEYGALVAAGVMSFAAALEAVSARGRRMANLDVGDPGALAAVSAPIADVERVVEEVDGYVVLANVNSTNQLVFGGETEAVERAIEKILDRGERAMRLPVSHAFHTRIVAPVSEPLRATLRGMTLSPARLPVVANVDGEFYPTGPGVEEQIVDILSRQVASPVQFVKGLHTLYDAGARVLVETGPKRALWGFAADVLGDDAMTLFTNHPKVGELPSFNQALCGLYAAGVGAPSEPAAVPAARGERPAREAEPVVISGAAVGTPGTEKVFDEGNLARLLHGEQFIDLIPGRVRREIADRHITRLVKSEDGSGAFQTIDDPADVIKLAARAGELDLTEEFGIDADRLAALGRETRLAIAAGIDALRDAGIPLVQHYKDTTRGTKLPDRWRLPDALQDDTGVIFASAFPGAGDFIQDVNAFWTERVKRARLQELSEVRARADARRGPRRHRLPGRRARARPRAASVPLRPPLPVPRALHGPLAVRRDDRRARTQHADQLGLREHDAGRRRRRGLDPRGTLPARGRHCGRRRDLRHAAAVGRLRLPGHRRRRHRRRRRGGRAAVRPPPSRHAPRAWARPASWSRAPRPRASAACAPICELLGAVTANSAFHGTRLDVDHIGGVMEIRRRQAEARGVTATRSRRRPSSSRTRPTRRPAAAAPRPRSTPCAHVFGEQATTSSSPTPRASPGTRWASASRTSWRSRYWRPASCRPCRTSASRPGTRHAQPLQGRPIPGALRAAPGRRVRLADRHDAAPPDARRRRPPPQPRGARIRLPDRRPRRPERMAGGITGAGGPSSRSSSAGCACGHRSGSERKAGPRAGRGAGAAPRRRIAAPAPAPVPCPARPGPRAAGAGPRAAGAGRRAARAGARGLR